VAALSPLPARLWDCPTQAKGFSETMSAHERTTTAIRFPSDIHDQLRAAADERGMSINSLVVHLVEYGLPRLLPAGPSSLFVEDITPTWAQSQRNGRAKSR
jgi:hypothetical protein